MQNVESLKIEPRRVYTLLILCLFIFLFAAKPSVTAGQNNNTVDSSRILTGTITANDGSPLSQATVLLNNGRTTITDENGVFTFRNTEPGIYDIHTTIVGYTPKTEKINFTGKNGPVLIKMTSEDKSLEDVVVVGYQSVRRKDVTGAVTSVKGDQIKDIPVASVDQALQGMVPGLIVQNNSGAPGAAPLITVRGNSQASFDYNELNGSSQPLYIVDGVEQPVTSGGATGTNYLATLDMGTVESIEVLKDNSSTAIYGSRGANGVIIITTKKAKAGALKVTLSTYIGLTERPQLRKTLIGSEERRAKLDMVTAYYGVGSLELLSLPAVLTDSLNPAYNGAIDWQSKMYQSGFVRNHNLELTGGTKNISYIFNLSNYSEDGIVTGTSLDRYSAGGNLNGKSNNEKLTFSAYFNMSYANRGVGNGYASYPVYYNLNNTAMYNGLIPSSLFNLTPTQIDAVVGNFPKKSNANVDKNNSFTFQLSYKLNKNLTFTSRESYYGLTSRKDQYQTNEMNFFNGTTANTVDYVSDRFSASNFFLYENKFGKSKHSVSLLGGNDILYTTIRNTNVSATGGSNDMVEVISGYSPLNTISSTNHSVYTSASFYGSFRYNFDQKYYFTFTERADGSSRFGASNKWAYFPSGAINWIVSEENFMKNQQLISYMKLRATYGESGSEISNPYLQYNLFSIGNGNYGSRVTGQNIYSYNGVTAITPNFSTAAQPALTWARTKDFDLGIDVEFLKGRIKASVDKYIRDNTDMLFFIQLPPTSGFVTASTNAVGTRNKGWDISLTTQNMPRQSEWRWTTTLNATINDAVITSLPNDGRDLYFGNYGQHINSRGAALNSFYLF